MAAALILLEESPHLTPAVPSSATAHRTPGLVRRLAVPAAVAVVVAAAVAAATWWAMRPEAPRIVRTSIVLTGNAGPQTRSRSHLTAHASSYTSNNQTQLLVRALDELEPRPLVSGSNILRGLFGVPRQSIGRVHGWRHADESGVDRGAGDPHCPSRCAGARHDVAGRRHHRLCHGRRDDGTAACRGERRRSDRPDQARLATWRRRPYRAHAPARRTGGAVHDYVEYRRSPTDCACWTSRPASERSSSAGTQARYLASGHLVYAVDGVLQAVPFDLRHADDHGAHPCRCSSNSATIGGVIPVLDVAANWHARVRPGKRHIARPGVGRSRWPRNRDQGARRHVSDAAALA